MDASRVWQLEDRAGAAVVRTITYIRIAHMRFNFPEICVISDPKLQMLSKQITTLPHRRDSFVRES